MRFAALLLLVPLAGTAQTKPEDLASLEGQVFDAATGGAVRKASILLRRTDGGSPPGFHGYSTSTDDSGKFATKDLEPGRYRMTVSRTGYVSAEYGARGPDRPGTTVSLDRAQRLTGLTVKLTPQGVVTGRIVDRDGDPVAGVQVVLLRYRYQQGRKQLDLSADGTTNDLGEYRIAGVLPGKYYLSATYPGDPALRLTADRSATEPSSQEFVPTYFPGTADASTASELTVMAGAELRADLALEKVRTARISGRVVTAIGDPAINFPWVSLVPRGSAYINNSGSTGAGGTFELRGVAPGSYYLVAAENAGGRTYATRMPVEMGESDLEDVTLTIGSNLEAGGHVSIDGDSSVRLTSIRLSLDPRGAGPIFGVLPNATVAEDGTFHLEQVNPGIYNLNVPGLPRGFYVKSIMSGDTDVMANGLDLLSGAVGDVEVVLSPNAGQVAGLVQDSQARPVAGATVVLIPQDLERRDQQRDYWVATTDQAGGFNLFGVVPGEYQVYAWEDVETGAYFDPEFVGTVESKGQKISVHEKDQVILQVEVIPADGAR